jgi:hypothetical protein
MTEIFSLTLREEHRLRVFKNSSLEKKIFWPKRESNSRTEEIAAEECNVYSSPIIVRVIKSRRMGKACGMHG